MPNLPGRAHRTTNGQMRTYFLCTVSYSLHAFRRCWRLARETSSMAEMPYLLGSHLRVRDASCAFL